VHLAERFVDLGPAEKAHVRTIQTAMPRVELKPFVRVFAQREIARTSEGFRQLDIASLEQILSFGFGEATRLDYTNGRSKLVPRVHVVGSQTAPSSCAHFNGYHFDFGIFLKPAALWQLFRIPPAVVSNEDGDGRDLIGGGIYTLWLKLAECRNFLERIRVAEEYLLPFAIHAQPKSLVMKSAQYACVHSGAVRIEDLANFSGLSLRQYERRFVAETGITPKLFARIRRFQMALDTKRLSPGRSWMSVAHRLGYFDQMHMIRDFQSLGGTLPGEIFDQIGDFQPWSLGEALQVRLGG
jgi:AraC-like DNA-binding protein